MTIWKLVEPDLKKQVEDAYGAQTALLEEYPELQSEEREDALREGLNAQRAALTTMLSTELISDAVYEELVTEVDEAIARIPRAVEAKEGSSRKIIES